MGISPINFIKFKSPFGFFNEIKNGNISLKKKKKKEQNEFKSNFGEIKTGNPKRKEKYQSDTIKNIKNIWDLRQKIIDLLSDSEKIGS